MYEIMWQDVVLLLTMRHDDSLNVEIMWQDVVTNFKPSATMTLYEIMWREVVLYAKEAVLSQFMEHGSWYQDWWPLTEDSSYEANLFKPDHGSCSRLEKWPTSMWYPRLMSENFYFYFYFSNLKKPETICNIVINHACDLTNSSNTRTAVLKSFSKLTSILMDLLGGGTSLRTKPNHAMCHSFSPVVISCVS